MNVIKERRHVQDVDTPMTKICDSCKSELQINAVDWQSTRQHELLHIRCPVCDNIVYKTPIPLVLVIIMILIPIAGMGLLIYLICSK